MSPPSPSSSPNIDSTYSSSSFTSQPNQDSHSAQSNLQNLLRSACKHRLLEEVDKLKEAVQKDDKDKVIMAIPMLLALTVCPAMLGTQEAIRQSQSKTKREEHRGRRCNLVVSCVKPSIRSRDINNKLVVLKDSKLYIANEHPLYNHDPKNSISKGYAFSGYFLPFPDSEYEGLVTTISDDPPFLNWIYIDKNTYEVKYGVRADTEGHITGPFDCTKQDRRMMCESWEGFCAVEELPGIWALYYDRDDDGLRSKVAMGTRVLEVELTRREKKEPKPAPDPSAPKTVDEKMKQHKEQTAKEEAEKAEFMATGRHPGAEPPSPAQKPEVKNNTFLDPDSKEAKKQRIADALSRLNIDSPTKSEGGSDGSILTSLSQDFSIFSLAKKMTDTTNNDEEATVASSLWGGEREKGNDKDKGHKKCDSASEAGSYKKPTVEEG
ncbi:unnamed protein product [Fusarium graminearum]|uniref:Chromosome 4, complete genome n=3 Tax=Gibberella zeae TaxID=5518 RepID=A0A0E0SFJ1_GIBZE|nr:hypothetical protein FG05_09826 [Fusarium graminearum]KAI6769434.1 hypothetical protein HG531_010538 [Fusarium graminearum]PCD18056.1 hypothetical protein FGRA07_07524 [Fusarium graminearum]CAF3470118.1 unnamed protein product [Fusarium graminearum]CAF3522010.1 unnamed protein product [Fusarium graminearum]